MSRSRCLINHSYSSPRSLRGHLPTKPSAAPTPLPVSPSSSLNARSMAFIWGLVTLRLIPAVRNATRRSSRRTFRSLPLKILSPTTPTRRTKTKQALALMKIVYETAKSRRTSCKSKRNITHSLNTISYSAEGDADGTSRNTSNDIFLRMWTATPQVRTPPPKPRTAFLKSEGKSIRTWRST